MHHSHVPRASLACVCWGDCPHLPVAAMPMEEVGKGFDYAWMFADSMGYMCADMTMYLFLGKTT